MRDYFETSFVKQEGIRATKAGVLGRLDQAFSNPQLRKMLSESQSTFQLCPLLEQGKVILINASQGLLGQKGTNILGSMLLAELTTFALSRALREKEARTPIFVYVDECQNFLTHNMGKILTEARKYAVHLTLANQTLGQFSGDGLVRLKKEILANTSVKCCGDGSDEDKRTMGNEMGAEVKEIPHLHKGKFVVKAGEKRPVAISFQDFLVKEKDSPFYLDESNWQVLEKYQLKQYYKHHPRTPADPEPVFHASSDPSTKIHTL